MLEKVLAAAADLKSLLELGDYCVWDVNPHSPAYKLGLLVGVTLPWPGNNDETQDHVGYVQRGTQKVAEKHGLEASIDGPGFAAGGVLVVYCGFVTPALVAAKKKAEEQGKPIWKVCEENPELLAFTE